MATTSDANGRPAALTRRTVLGTGLIAGLGPLLPGSLLLPGMAQARRLVPGGAARNRPDAVASVPFRFRYTDFDIRELPVTARPYHMSSPVSLTDGGIHDAHGVRMVRRDGRLYDHPVAQAQYGLQLLEAYRLTGNPEYLRRARKQAQRILDRRVAERGAWFYPYPFRFQLHGRYDVYEPPWYSMMAQGQALSLFCRLTQVTGEATWRTAATATFTSYLLPRVAGRPWGVYVVDGLLWFEEYPHPTRHTGDLTYNGHNFAVYGLWDYWVLTGDPSAALLMRGGLTAARDVYPDLRDGQWRSKYCLTHGSDSGGYHTLHMKQLLQMYAITGDTVFARIAEQAYTDFPPHGADGMVRFAGGTHVGYRFDTTGRVIASKRISLSRRSSAPATDRLRVRQQAGLWYRISAGMLAGYYLQEVPRHSYLIGTRAEMAYLVPRPGRIAVAPLTAYHITPGGRMTPELTDYRVGDAVTVDVRAVLNGVEHLRLDSGRYAGRWVGYPGISRT